MELPATVKVILFLGLCYGFVADAKKALQVGDVVLVASNKETVVALQENHGGYNGDMDKALGKIGRVRSLESDGDIQVRVCGTTWFYNPDAVTKIASSGDVPRLDAFADTCEKGPVIEISKKRVRKVGRTIDLDCTVKNNTFNSTYVRWSKGDLHFSRDTTLEVTDPRIMIVFDDDETFTLQIDDIQLEDAGWYMCELVSSDGNSSLSAAAVELVVHHPPVFYDNSTSSLTVDEGESATLECFVKGYPRPSVTWHRVFRESIAPIDDLIYRGDTLEIEAVRDADEGGYYCVADNGAGLTARRDVHLMVSITPNNSTGPSLVRARDEPKLATTTMAPPSPPSLVEQMRIFAEQVTNSTREIRQRVDEANNKLRALNHNFTVPDGCFNEVK